MRNWILIACFTFGVPTSGALALDSGNEAQGRSSFPTQSGEIMISRIDISKMSEECQQLIKQNGGRIPLKCMPGSGRRGAAQGQQSVAPDEQAWRDAKKRLEDQEKPVNFSNLQPLLPPTMVAKLESEADAYVEDCLVGESNSPMKARDCTCYRGVYLDERSKEFKFNLANRKFNEGIVGGKVWKQCLVETGVKDYAYEACTSKFKQSRMDGRTDKDQETYCHCYSDAYLKEYLDVLVDGSFVSVNANGTAKADLSCR